MKTIFYSGCTDGEIATLCKTAHVLGYELVPFDGYTRFGHDQRQRDQNLAALREIMKIVGRIDGRQIRIWDTAPDDVVRAADAEWAARHGNLI